MYGVPVKSLLDAGVHFGHRASRWNPKMERYIFGKRNLIHIIDLKHTLRGLMRACGFLENLASRGNTVLFVGTKRQAQNIVIAEASKVEMPFVAERWLGGTLTNFETIRSRLQRLEELETMETDGSLVGLSKKEIAAFLREKRKIFRNLHGIRKMGDIPGALVVVDPRKEKTAVREAQKMGIPTIAILDTDCDPDGVDIPIPANDDAVRSIQLLLGRLAEAITNGKKSHAQFIADEETRRADADRRRDEDRQTKLADQRKKASEQAELEKILAKAREERTRRRSSDARDGADAEGGEAPKADAPATPAAEAPAASEAPKEAPKAESSEG